MGTQKILLKKSTVEGKAPISTDLDIAELAVNTADSKLYTKHSDGTIKRLSVGTNATTSADGLMSAADKTKLGGIEAGAEVNNISDTNATELTGGEATALHTHSFDDLEDKPDADDIPATTAKKYILNVDTLPETGLAGVLYYLTTDLKYYKWNGTAFEEFGAGGGGDDFADGYNTVTTLASLPVTKQSVLANLGTNTTLSLAATLESGKELHLKMYNTSTSNDIVQDITDATIDAKTIYGDLVQGLFVPFKGTAEAKIWAINSKYIVSSDAINADNKYQVAAVYGDYTRFLYKSVDFGKTFTKYNYTWARYVQDLYISQSGQYWLAILYFDGIYQSSDYGNTWSYRAFPYFPRACKMSSDGKYRLIIKQDEYIYLSKDYGVNYDNRDIVGARDWRGIATSNDGRVMAAVAYGNYIWVSTDSEGSYWTQITDAGLRNWIGIDISGDGQYQTAVVSSGNIYISSSYGQSWVEISLAKNWLGVIMSKCGQYQTAWAPSEVYISNDYGYSWKRVIPTIGAQIKKCSMSPSGRWQTLAIEQVNYSTGHIYKSNDYGNSWKLGAIDDNVTSVAVNR